MDSIVGFLYSPLGFLAFAFNLTKKIAEKCCSKFNCQLLHFFRMIGLHSRIEPDRFSTSVLSLYTLSFRLASSLAFISSSRFPSSRYSFFGVIFMDSTSLISAENRISFHVWLHRLIVLVLFSVSSLTNDWQHGRICVPIVSRLRPCLSTGDRFVNLRHLHRLLHWRYLSVRQI